MTKLLKPKVSILVAAYNEEAIITDFLKVITGLMKNFAEPWEMIIVENGSTDRTAQLVREFAGEHPEVALKRLPKPAYGEAMIEAFKSARGDYAVFFNVDLYDKRFIELCKINLLGYDMVGSSKLLKNSHDMRPFGRRLVTRIYSEFLQLALGFKGTDTHGVKVFKTKTVLPLLQRCKTRTGIFDSELVLRCQRAGLSFLELPVDVREIRPTRFKVNRILKTPFDLWQLYFALRGS